MPTEAPKTSAELLAPSPDSDRIEWLDNKHPISKQFDESYFPKHKGLEASHHRFLKNKQLLKHWQALDALAEPWHFCIGETGFGTGLNFLATWQLWQSVNLQHGHLHFISVEKHPLSAGAIRKAAGNFAELSTLAQALCAAYPKVLCPGTHYREFQSDRVSLQLIFADVVDGLSQLKYCEHPALTDRNRCIDAWFLDGFSLIKNPEMWRAELYPLLRELSKTGASVATAICADEIQDGLKAQGFLLHKNSSVDSKKEGLFGVLDFNSTSFNSTNWDTTGLDSADLNLSSSVAGNNNNKQSDEKSINAQQPSNKLGKKHQAISDWSKLSYHNSPYPSPWNVAAPSKPPKSVVIIGGGIAGCISAWYLATLDVKVTLIDQRQNLASEASGNPQGVVYAKLSHRLESLSQFNLLSLMFAQEFYRPLIETNKITGSLCGVAQLSTSEKQSKAQAKIQAFLESFNGKTDWCQHLTAKELSEISGSELSQDGLWFPDSMWINPRSLCESLCQHKNISQIFDTEITELKSSSPNTSNSNSNSKNDEKVSTCPNWQAYSHDVKIAEADAVILANANSAVRIAQCQHLPIKPVRGQVSYSASSTQSEKLNCVLCARGYIAPAHQGQHCFGASFNLHEQHCDTSVSEHAHNIELLQEDMPALHQALAGEQGLDPAKLEGRAALRCTSPDYLPIVGPVPQVQAMQERFSLLAKNAKSNIPFPGEFHPGLYVNTAYGSRGLCYAPLATVQLCHRMMGLPSPVGLALEKSLHPARFIIRDIIRSKAAKKT